jgi:amino acid transporter
MVGAEADPQRTLGTYLGVFRPTLLTILGIVLYLREGWVIGNAGLLGGLAIITLTFLITGATALSLGSVATNTRMGAGGAFALVSSALGLEAGGAIGLPLYLAQALSVAFYMHGFSEAWIYLFPHHSHALVLLGVFTVGTGLSLVSEKLALRSHFIVLIAVVVALASMGAGALNPAPLHAPQLIGDFQQADFWEVFGVFFPAGTGIMVGVSMSGKLKNPRRSIPLGVLGAWAVAFVVYAIAAVWYSSSISPETLRNDHLAAVGAAYFGPVVLVGLMASCFSAMMGSLVAAPNVLIALAQNRLVPASGWLKKQSRSGTPRNALVVTAAIAGVALACVDLNGVARIITVFFLLTYAVIDIVVLVEQLLGMISFRPTLRVPVVVPIVGAAATLGIMIHAEPTLAMTSLVGVVTAYIFYVKRDVETPWETVRSGMVVALARWVARAVQQTEGPQYRAWRPDLLVPVTDAAKLEGQFRLVEGLAHAGGSVRLVAVVPPEGRQKIAADLEDAVLDLRSRGLVADHAEVGVSNLVTAVDEGLSFLQGAIVRPNLLYVDASTTDRDTLLGLEGVARREDVGLAVFCRHPDAGLGREKRVTVWIRDQEAGLATAVGKSNLDLLLLFSLLLGRCWQAEVTLATITSPGREEAARALLEALRAEARLPRATLRKVIVGDFEQVLADAPRADLHLFGLPSPLDPDKLREMVERLDASCLFVRDSSQESAFA